eukprot:scaffold122775_cov45-Phaeocystis_antarctica.AAC.1
MRAVRTRRRRAACPGGGRFTVVRTPYTYQPWHHRSRMATQGRAGTTSASLRLNEIKPRSCTVI